MTSKADRSAISRAVAKAIAYHDCGKPEKAAAGGRSCAAAASDPDACGARQPAGLLKPAVLKPRLKSAHDNGGNAGLASRVPGDPKTSSLKDVST